MIECVLGGVIFILLIVVWQMGKREHLGNYVAKPVVSFYTSRMGGSRDTVYVALHATDWCPGCKMFKPTWEAMKKTLDGQNIVFAEIDEDKAHTPWISQYPTVIMVYHGASYQYSGPNRLEDLCQFILDASKK